MNNKFKILLKSIKNTKIWKWILNHSISGWKYILLTVLILILLFTFSDWFRGCISNIRIKTEGTSKNFQERVNYSSDRNWNTCIFNTAKFFAPEEVKKCDTIWGSKKEIKK